MVALTLVTGCVSKTHAPPLATISNQRPDASQVALYISSFQFDFKDHEYKPIPSKELRDSFISYLRARTQFKSVTASPSAPPEGDVLSMDVRVHFAQSSMRTWLLDAAFLYNPFFAGLVAPHWGEVDITIQASLNHQGVKNVWQHKGHANENYMGIFATWYRNDYIHKSIAQAYQTLFNRLAIQLRNDLPEIAARQQFVLNKKSPSSTQKAIAAKSDEGKRKEAIESLDQNLFAELDTQNTVAPLKEKVQKTEPSPSDSPVADSPVADSPVADSPIVDSPVAAHNLATKQGTPLYQEIPEHLLTPPSVRDRFHIIRSLSPDATSKDPVLNALKALGGVEVSLLLGITEVSSKGVNDDGDAYEVASGGAKQSGYRIAFYGAPTQTGFFVSPTGGFLSQDISISDFRRDMPSTDIAGRDELDVLCSDPDTGDTIDCHAPNTYNLQMRSAYGGARTGYDFVVGTSYFQLFSSVNLALNLLEYRWMDAQISDTVFTDESSAFLQSGALGATIGMAFPKAHFSLRAMADYEVYREFEYGKAIPFEGLVQYDSTTHRYEREVVYLESASLKSWTFQVALAGLF